MTYMFIALAFIAYNLVGALMWALAVRLRYIYRTDSDMRVLFGSLWPFASLLFVVVGVLFVQRTVTDFFCNLCFPKKAEDDE
jgi:hypothetical protein